MRPRKIILNREELLRMQEHLNPYFVNPVYFQRVLEELDEKPVWHRKDFRVPEGNEKILTICNYCRRIYAISPRDDTFFLKDPQTRKEIHIPYCEVHALSIMKQRLDSQVN